MQIYGAGLDPQAVSLSRYASIVGYTEWAFFGISHSSNYRYSIREIWNEHQRQEIVSSLSQAQSMLEDVIGYPLAKRWIAGERHNLSGNTPEILLTKWCDVQDLGVELNEVLSENVLIDYTGSIPTVSILVSEDVPIQEVHVFHPGESEEIESSRKSSVPSGSNFVITIQIPQPRLVTLENRENPEEGWTSDDLSKFLSVVDVRRIRNDSSVQANFIRRINMTSSFGSEEAYPGLEYCEDPVIGKIQTILYPSLGGCTPFEVVELNYSAGRTTISRVAENILVRLAHSLMPSEPCGEDVVLRLWTRDQTIPKILTKERIECPFGMSDGAWSAWKFAQNITVFRASTTAVRYS